MSNPQIFFLELVLAVVLIVALLSALVAAFANRRWPERNVGQLTTFTVFVLVLGLFALTVIWMFWFMSAPCPEGSACDAGAMAAAGAIMFGAMEVSAAVLVGAPVAYFTVLRLRRR